MNNNYKNSYDLLARHFMSNKQILAHLLKTLVKEYKELSIEDIYKLIDEGDGTSGDYVKGITTNDVNNNKEIRLDVVFTPKLPNSDDKIGMYIGIEPQNDVRSYEKIYKRALYYNSRLISRQANEVFINSDYEKLKKTYSIWILFNPLVKYQNKIFKFSLVPKFNAEEYAFGFDFDYINIIMLNMGKDYDYNKHGLLEMLSLIFKSNLSSEDASNKLKTGYNVSINKEDIKQMYGFSYGIEQAAKEEGFEKGFNEGLEKGIEKGIEQGIQQGIEQGIQQGIEQGIEQGTLKSCVDNIYNLMFSLNISFDKAIELLKIDSSIIDDVKALYKEKYN